MLRVNVATSKTYIMHIGGLRGLAILAVILYHLNKSYCPGGYFGVDLFLVILGFFLIPPMERAICAKTFEPIPYVRKKLHRLLPTIIVVTLVTIVLSFFLFPSYILNQTLETARFTSFFAPNFCLDRQGSYFNPYAQGNPFLHFWYLGILVQTYVLVFILLLPAHLSGRKWASVLSWGILFVCVGLSCYAYQTSLSINSSTSNWLYRYTGIVSRYYNVFTRFWEIGAGSIAYFAYSISSKQSGRLWKSLHSILSLAGLILFLYAAFTHATLRYAVLGAVLLVSFGQEGPVSKLMSLHCFQWLGKISYSLYICHWPVLVFWKYICLDSPTILDEVLMAAVSLALSYVVWRYVESKKFSALFSTGIRSIGTLACFVFICFTCSVGSVSKIVRMVTQTIDGEQLYASLNNAPKNNLLPSGSGILSTLEKCSQGAYALGDARGRTPSFVIMGDSHAAHYRAGIHAAAQKRGLCGLALADSLAPIWNYAVPFNRRGEINWDEQYAAEILNFLQEQKDIRVVILSMHWERRLFKECFPGRQWDSTPIPENRKKFISDGLREFCRRVNSLGKVVVLLRDTPGFTDKPIGVGDEMVRRIILHMPQAERKVSAEEFDSQHADTDVLFQDIAARGYAIIVDPTHLCRVGESYPAVINGHVMYRDNSHLSFHGSIVLGDYIMEELEQYFRGADKKELQAP